MDIQITSSMQEFTLKSGHPVYAMALQRAASAAALKGLYRTTARSTPASSSFRWRAKSSRGAMLCECLRVTYYRYVPRKGHIAPPFAASASPRNARLCDVPVRFFSSVPRLVYKPTLLPRINQGRRRALGEAKGRRGARLSLRTQGASGGSGARRSARAHY